VAAERADFSSWQIYSPFVAKSLPWYPLACVDRSLKKAKKGKKPGWPLMNADKRRLKTRPWHLSNPRSSAFISG
jgi:hypothetical protein